MDPDIRQTLDEVLLVLKLVTVLLLVFVFGGAVSSYGERPIQGDPPVAESTMGMPLTPDHSAWNRSDRHEVPRLTSIPTAD